MVQSSDLVIMPIGISEHLNRLFLIDRGLVNINPTQKSGWVYWSCRSACASQHVSLQQLICALSTTHILHWGTLSYADSDRCCLHQWFNTRQHYSHGTLERTWFGVCLNLYIYMKGINNINARWQSAESNCLSTSCRTGLTIPLINYPQGSGF